jgi:putative endonuclease
MKEKGWSLYILKCKGDRLYCGITNDLEGRLKAHSEGRGSKFVRAFSPFELSVVVSCINSTGARKLECKVKKMRRVKKLEFIEAHKKEFSKIKRKKMRSITLMYMSPFSNSSYAERAS